MNEILGLSRDRKGLRVAAGDSYYHVHHDELGPYRWVRWALLRVFAWRR